MKCPMCGSPPGMGAFEVHPPGQHLGQVIEAQRALAEAEAALYRYIKEKNR